MNRVNGEDRGNELLRELLHPQNKTKNIQILHLPYETKIGYWSFCQMHDVGDNSHLLGYQNILQDLHDPSIFRVASVPCDPLIPGFVNVVFKNNEGNIGSRDKMESSDTTATVSSRHCYISLEKARLSTEPEARVIFKQLLGCISYLHSFGICHGNISLKKIRINQTNGRVILLPSDKSFKILASSPSRNTQYGEDHAPEKEAPGHQQYSNQWDDDDDDDYEYSASYWAPEMLADNHLPYLPEACDLHACVIILFEILTGHHLYERPHASDMSYRFFVMAKALSTKPLNENVCNVVHEIYGNKNDKNCMLLQHILSLHQDHVIGNDGATTSSSLGHDSETRRNEVEPDINLSPQTSPLGRTSDSTVTASGVLKTHRGGMSQELLELFENTLCTPRDLRWNVQQVLVCAWMTKY